METISIAYEVLCSVRHRARHLVGMQYFDMVGTQGTPHSDPADCHMTRHHMLYSCCGGQNEGSGLSNSLVVWEWTPQSLDLLSYLPPSIRSQNHATGQPRGQIGLVWHPARHSGFYLSSFYYSVTHAFIQHLLRAHWVSSG